MTANEIDGRGVGVSKRMLRSLQAKPCFIAKRLPDLSRGSLTTNLCRVCGPPQPRTQFPLDSEKSVPLETE